MRPLCWIAVLLTGLTLGVSGCSAPAPRPPAASVAVPVSATPIAAESLASIPKAASNRVLVVADGRGAADRCLVVVHRPATYTVARRGLLLARSR